MDINNTKVTPLLGGFKRVGKFPIDLYSVFNTKNELNAYLQAEHSTAYAGQLISVVSEDLVYYVSNQDELIEVAKYSDIQRIDGEITAINTALDTLERDLAQAIDDETAARQNQDNIFTSQIQSLTGRATSLETNVGNLSNRINTLLEDSDADLNTLKKIAQWIKANKADIDQIKATPFVVDAYTRAQTDSKLLELKQTLEGKLAQAIPGGVIVNVTKVSELENDLGYLTGADKTELEGMINLLSDDEGLTETLDSIKEAADKISELEGTLDNLDIDGKIDTKLVDYATIASVPTKVSDLQNDSGFLSEQNSVTVLTATGNATDESLLATIANPNQADMAIVTREISTGKISRTAYAYNGSAWAAMDGNYNANNVYLTDNITLAGNYSQVGNITKTENGTATFATAGKTVAEAFNEIFSKKVQPTITKQPAARFKTYSAPADTTVEPGTSISGTISYELELSDPGEYSFGPATEVGESGEYNLTYQINETTPESINTKAGSFDYNFVIDTANIVITISDVSVGYTNGVTAKDNLGNASSPVVAISTNSAAVEGKTITWASSRKSFWSVDTNINGEINNNTIRAFSNSEFGAKLNYSLVVPNGTKRVVIAVPGNHSMKECIDIVGLHLDVKENFTKETITVGGADSTSNSLGSYSTSYSVFKCENFAGLKPTTYNIILE